MDNDNIYPNFGQPFTTQASKGQEKTKEKKTQETLDQIPLLKEVLKHFDERIAFYDSLNSIQVDIDDDPLTFQKVHAANKLTRDNLKLERGYIHTRIESVS